MLVDTMASPAWKAMSPYARVVYYTLKSRYGHKTRNNGRIYLSARDGAEDTGFHKDTIVRSLRELQHYGFIVMTKAGCLGVEGKGVAPHWRLTELGYMHELPTRDFLKWDGEMFQEQKSPKYYLRNRRKKQNPVLQDRTVCPTAPDIPVSYSTGHINGEACPTAPDISRVNHSAAAAAVPLVPATSVVPDIGGIEISSTTWVGDWDGLPPDKEMVDACIAAWLETGSDLSVPALA